MNLESEEEQIEWKQVDQASTFKEALAEKKWDIILSDFAMPGFTGLDALNILREEDPITPFILVSGAIGEETAIEIMRKGAQDYVLKKNLKRLATAVRRELAESKIKQKAIRAETELKENNKRLNAIYHNTNDCMSLLRVDKFHLTFESVNKGFLSFCMDQLQIPFDAKEYEGTLFTYFLRQHLALEIDVVEEVIDLVERVELNQQPERMILELSPKEEILYMDSQFSPIVENGTVTHVLWVSRDTTESILSSRKLSAAYEEVERLKNHLEIENKYLQEEIKGQQNFDKIIYQSREFEQILQQAKQVAPLDTTVLILGETGTGKELIARAIHEHSSRKDNLLVKVNCAALPRELIESELFGYEKGAFTGASQQKLGRFELAQNGTILLDEIGDLPVELQPKLFRVLQEGELQRLGGTQSIQLNIRVIAATNRDLKIAMALGTFREDLYYRLNVFPIEVPPLRQRKEDIFPLTSFFLSKYSQKIKKKIHPLSSIARRMLEEYEWPGNVRELENLVERAVILAQNGQLPFQRLLGKPSAPIDLQVEETTKLHEIEKSHILKVLTDTKWKINGPGGAAEKLGLTPSTVRDRMKKHGIVRPGSS